MSRQIGRNDRRLTTYALFGQGYTAADVLHLFPHLGSRRTIYRDQAAWQTAQGKDSRVSELVAAGNVLMFEDSRKRWAS